MPPAPKPLSSRRRCHNRALAATVMINCLNFAELAALEQNIKRKIGFRKRKGGTRSQVEAAIRKRVEKKYPRSPRHHHTLC